LGPPLLRGIVSHNAHTGNRKYLKKKKMMVSYGISNIQGSSKNQVNITMQNQKECWRKLCANAENFHLALQKFDQLRPFFESLDGALFQELSTAAVKKFPMERVQKFFSGHDLEKFLLLCVVANYDFAVQKYQQEKWPEMMLQEILCDLRLWLDTLERDLGGYGLTPRIFNWSIDCLNGEVKSYGRLQGNSIHGFCLKRSIYRQKDGSLLVKPAYSPENPPRPDLAFSDKVINIHIPARGPLDRKECIRSLKRMTEFSGRFFPDYDYRAIVCYSWLLDRTFREFLKPESNIVQFQKLGHTFNAEGHFEDREIRWRLWGNRGNELPLEQLPVSSSIQRGVVQTLLNGGHFYEGVLVIFKDELPALFAEL